MDRIHNTVGALGRHLKGGLLAVLCILPVAAVAHDAGKKAEESAFKVALVEEAPGMEDRLTGRRIRKLADYIEDTFMVNETKAYQIVQEAVRHADAHEEIQPELILAIIAVESTFRERAVSPVGARGLMQVMAKYHPQKVRSIGGPDALFDPNKNMSVGTRILADYLELADGNLRNALLRYNGSLGNPRSRYADKVMRVYGKLKEAGEIS